MNWSNYGRWRHPKLWNELKRNEMKKLFRSTTDSRIGGVCGGIAEYTNSDPTIWRLLFLALICAPFPMIFMYCLAWIIIPKK